MRSGFTPIDHLPFINGCRTVAISCEFPRYPKPCLVVDAHLVMTPTRFLIGQILIVFAIIIGSVWFATQWTASKLGYQPRLGHHWFILADIPIYKPWRFFQWWYAYEAYAPPVFNRAGLVTFSSVISSILLRSWARTIAPKR